MTFWLASGLILLIALGLLAWPMWLAPRRAAGSTVATDRDLFHEEIDALPHDPAFQAMSPTERKQHENELLRSLLNRQRQTSRMTLSWGSRPPWALLALLMITLPLGAFGLYSQFGQPDFAKPEAAEEAPSEAKTILPEAPPNLAGLGLPPNILDLVQQVEAALKKNPDDREGWEVVAPVYSRLGQHEKAAKAYGRIYALGGNPAENSLNEAQAVLASRGGQFNERAFDLFQRVLSTDAKNFQARYFLAIADIQQDRPKAALATFDQLLTEVPKDSEIFRALTIDRAQIAKSLTLPLGGASAEQRQLILGMVNRLDGRTKAEGGSLDEWQRLVRAFVVLGQEEEALARLRAGLTNLGEGTDEAAKLAQFASGLGLKL